MKISNPDHLHRNRSITLVGEADRRMLKAAIKQSASSQIHNRVIPSTAIQSCAKKLEALRSEVGEVLNEEKEEKAIRQADMEVTKGQNMIQHEEEIFGRPKRVWFQTEKEKQKAKGGFRPFRESQNSLLMILI